MFFYLLWVGKRPSKIEFLKEKPLDIDFSETFKIKTIEYTICGKIDSNFKNYEFPDKNKYTKSVYLSSHLQKAIRRMDSEKSVKTALHFINLDYNSFIRRLPIIMLEDVTFHECFPVLIWLMIANTKGFTIKEEIIKWLLGVVYTLSQIEEYTEYLKYKDTVEMIHENIYLQSLSFRKSYGGMKGDMEMIEYYKRHIDNSEIIVRSDKISIIKLDIGDLEYKDWIKSANDFHCNRYIIKHVGKYTELDDEKIKRLIWIFRSCFNKRHQQIEYDDKDTLEWEKIKKNVNRFQKNCQFY